MTIDETSNLRNDNSILEVDVGFSYGCLLKIGIKKLGFNLKNSLIK